MDNQTQPIGYLFGNLGFKSQKDISDLIDNLNQEQALVILTKAIDSAYEKGVYNMIESEILSKSIRILTTQYSDTDKK